MVTVSDAGGFGLPARAGFAARLTGLRWAGAGGAGAAGTGAVDPAGAADDAADAAGCGFAAVRSLVELDAPRSLVGVLGTGMVSFGVAAARLPGLPRTGMARSAGENGSSSRPNRTTSHSSDSAGSVS